MLSWLGKLLPYFIVSKLIRKFGSDFLHCNELGKCKGWRIDKGEWIVWSQDNYDRMKENEAKQKQLEEEDKRIEELGKLEELKKKYSSFDTKTSGVKDD